MYSDLFEQLGAGGGAGGGGRNANNASSGPEQPPSILTLKAGKMNLTADAAKGTYNCVADNTRGEIRLVWKDAGLNWQWYDRRNRKVMESHKVSQFKGSKFERVDLSAKGKKHKNDRVYVWLKNPDEHQYDMYWMQDDVHYNKDGTKKKKAKKEEETKEESKEESKKEESKDADDDKKEDGGDDSNKDKKEEESKDSSGMDIDEDDDEAEEKKLIAKLNGYLQDPESAMPESDRNRMLIDNAAGGSSSGGAAGASSGGASSNQVDALSSILENLGMPANAAAAQTSGSGAGSSDAAAAVGAGTAAAAAGTGGGNTLTLADLQGAMAGIQQQQQASSQGGQGPSLAEVATPTAIQSLLDDESVKERLIDLLPEEQRTAKDLEDNLRSPQVQATLRSLTMALMPDDNGNLDGYASVIANFGFDPKDGQATLTSTNNPVLAFLDCVLKSVEKEKKKNNEDGGDDAAAAAAAADDKKKKDDDKDKDGGGETKEEEMKDA